MIDLHAKQLRDEFWANDALNGSPIGKPYKEIEFLSESSYDEGLEIRQKNCQKYFLMHECIVLFIMG